MSAPILEAAAYSHVFDRWRGTTIKQFWGPGNVGDLLIRRGAEQLFAAYDIRVTDELALADAVFYGGGGNMGPLYPGTRVVRLAARDAATKRGVPLVVLPQSWTGPEDFDADFVFAREHRSLKYCPSAVLAPDLALAFSPAIQHGAPEHETGFFLRSDAERNLPLIPSNCGDPAFMTSTAEGYLRLAASYRVVHTDRLHFAIAAMMCGREAHLYANSYFKNEAIYHLWLRGRGCHWGAQVN
jgi:exopolysaccharide biosynthesis predicted pyruvyltransferase EpsI